MARQQVGDPVEAAVTIRRHGVPPLPPAPDLPFEVAAGPAEVTQTAHVGIDEMQVGERVHNRQPDPVAWLLTHGQLLGHAVPHHHAGAIFRDQEVRPDDGVVGAEVQCPRRTRVGRGQPREHRVLAAHVVRAGRDHAERRAAHDHGALAEPDQVGQVGRAVRELQHRELAVRAGEMPAQVSLERRPVEFLARAHRGDFGTVGELAHQRPSSSAIRVRSARAAPKVASSPRARRR